MDKSTSVVAPLVAAVVLAGAACGGGAEAEESAPTEAALDTIEIVETDFRLAPANVTINAPGAYTFRAVNDGEFGHALALRGEGTHVATDELAPGAVGELTVELKAGRYQLFCPIGDHGDRGMTGSLTVVGDGVPSGPAITGGGDTTTGGYGDTTGGYGDTTGGYDSTTTDGDDYGGSSGSSGHGGGSGESGGDDD